MMEMVPDKKDETLLFAIIGFIRLSGIKVLPQSYLMKKLILRYTELILRNIKRPSYLKILIH